MANEAKKKAIHAKMSRKVSDESTGSVYKLGPKKSLHQHPMLRKGGYDKEAIEVDWDHGVPKEEKGHLKSIRRHLSK